MQLDQGITLDPHPDQGPVLVSIEYTIPPEHADQFTQAMRATGPIRRRICTLRWRLHVDMTAPDRYVETILVDSWAVHLRQNVRMTATDAAVRDHATGFYVGDTPPRSTHLLTVPPSSDS